VTIRPVENVDEIAARYLRNLNLCFANWGDERRFDWCFRRGAGAGTADLFVAEADDVLVAGSATIYRVVQRPGHAPEPIGCMTGSWTLSQARGRGLFGEMIAISRAQARRRGCRVLVAFVGAGRASRTALSAAGAHLLETAFLTSSGTGPRSENVDQPPSLDETMQTFALRPFDGATSHLIYTSDEWRGQMIDRPGLVERRRLGDGAIAIVEQAGEVDRLLDVSSSQDAFVASVLEAAATSHARGRLLSAYTLDLEAAEELTSSGFARSSAWLYVMPTRDEPLGHEHWWFANGDRM
jgi:hypothetical protein